MLTPTTRVASTLVLVAASAVALSHILAAADPARGAQLLQQFQLPETSLTAFGYSQTELDDAAPLGLVVDDQPAIGSGLVWLGGSHYMGITDRGPNIDHFPDTTPPCDSGSSNGKTHPLPQFTPAIVKFHAHGGVLELESILNLVGNDGTMNVGIGGLSNFAPDDDPSFLDPCAATPTKFDVNGMDVEDFVLLPNGKFLGVEENRPSVFIGDLGTGLIDLRYIPTGQTLPGANYSVNSTILPPILAKRSKNRGFESAAISPDSQTAFTVTQSPLEVGCSPNTAQCRNGRVLRILKLDCSDPSGIVVTGQYVFRMSDPVDYPSGSNARALKLSAMSWVGPNKLLLLERSDETGIGGVRLILADLEGATNINGLYDNSLVPEQTAGSVVANHVSRQVVFEEFENQPVSERIFWTYKLEGMVIRNANTVDIINDNDFGIVAVGAPTNLWTIRLSSQLPLGK